MVLFLIKLHNVLLALLFISFMFLSENQTTVYTKKIYSNENQIRNSISEETNFLEKLDEL